MYDTLNSGRSSASSSSGLMSPAMSRMNVVFPVPFSPSNTMISVSVNSPGSMCSVNEPCDLVIAGYAKRRNFVSTAPSRSSAVSATLNVSASSRKRKFSVGTKPARKMFMPSRTPKGIVTTPYAPGLPYKQQM